MACKGDLPALWWRDPDVLRAEYDAHESLAAAARAHGTTKETLAKWWTSHGFPTLPRGPKPAQNMAERATSSTDDAWLLDALKQTGDEASVEQLADVADVSPKRVREALGRLAAQGYRLNLALDDGQAKVVLARVPPPSDNVHRALFSGERVRFAVISDTHLGSKHCRLDELHQAYEVLRDEGVDTVYHPGDLVCGMGIFPGQLSTIDVHSYEGQVDYAVANYPRVDGVTTHLIAGNHDLEGDFGRVGANPVVAVCNQRPDLVYAGDYQATFELEQGTRIYLIHPKGGSSYALSYKPQKLIEGFEGGTKPNLVLIGHYHRRGLFEWRNVQALLSGCFEGGSAFGARLGLGEPAVGFHLVDMTVGDDGSIVRFRAEWLKFFHGRRVAA